MWAARLTRIALGRALLEPSRPVSWPAALQHERAAVLEELYSYTGEELGVLGDVEGGLAAIAASRRWHDASVAAYASLHGGARAPLAWLRGQRDLSEADLLVMAGDLTGAIRTLASMRQAVETLYEPKRGLLGHGTCASRLGAAQHILAVSMRSRLADPIGERALMLAALASQERGYDFRKQAWNADLDWQTMRNLAGQCRLLMANLAFALGRDADGQRWIDDGIALTRSVEVPKGGSWGYHWRARWLMRRGEAPAALKQLAIAAEPYASALDPRNTLAANAQAAVKEDLAEARGLTGDRAAADSAFREALGIRQRLVTAAPSNGEFASNLVRTVTHFASFMTGSGRGENARAETARALQLLRRQADAPNAVATRFTEYAWLLLVAQPEDLRDAGTALTYARRALDLPRGSNPDALAVLAVAQHQTGDTDSALATALRVYAMVPEMRAGRDDATLRRDIRDNLRRHPLRPLPRPVWF